MKTNFEIDEHYAIRINEVHIDIHNNFNYIGLINNKNNIIISFKKSKGDWVKKDEFEGLTFEFINVSYEYYEEGDSEASKEDMETLDEITFFPATSRKINDSIINQTTPKENDDLILFFEDGKIIRIGCKKINLTVEK